MNEDFKSRKILKYHYVFWGIKNQSQNVLRLMNLNLMSYLATQNLHETKLIFWKLENFPKNLEKQIMKNYRFYIEKEIIIIKICNVHEFC